MASTIKHRLTLDPSKPQAPTRDHEHHPDSAPIAKESKRHPVSSRVGGENAGLYFIGTATTLLEWEGIRILTDPNFLHAGDHVHLGPGVTGTRLTNPAIDLDELPPIDVVLLSHYHADHFDQEVEESLRRDLPILTTPHAKEHLHEKKSEDEKFTRVYDLDFFESALLDITEDLSSWTAPTEKSAIQSPTDSVPAIAGLSDVGAAASTLAVPTSASEDAGARSANITSEEAILPSIKVTGMPGKHVPPGPLSIANDFLKAIPPVNGWMVELGYKSSPTNDGSFQCGYRIYISGDTLLIDELKEIPERYRDQNIDLMLIHLGGTTIPSPKLPLLMVTMDAEQGVKLMRLIEPDVTIPIHYDDYDVFLSPLEDFKKAVTKAGFDDKVVYLDRAEEYKFTVKK